MKVVIGWAFLFFASIIFYLPLLRKGKPSSWFILFLRLQTHFYIPTITLSFSILIKGNRTRLFFPFWAETTVKKCFEYFYSNHRLLTP